MKIIVVLAGLAAEKAQRIGSEWDTDMAVNETVFSDWHGGNEQREIKYDT